MKDLLRHVLRLAAIPAFILLSLLVVPSLAPSGTSTPRPSWTEQSSYILGDELYTVGVASQASTIEEGRQQAFAHGVEMMNFAQTVDVSDLMIETQMMYEEPNPNSTFTVYRLLKVSLSKLLELKEEADGRGLDSPRMRETLKRLRVLRQGQVSQKLQVEPREQAIATQSKELEDQIHWNSTMACKYVKPDMTTSEVQSLLGKPDVDTLIQGFGTWQYGRTNIWFLKGRVDFVQAGVPC